MSPDITDPHLDIDDALQPLVAARHWDLGLSGGVDSTVLLHLLQDFRSRHESAPPLTAIHVDHGMQPGSSQWQQYCEQACSALEVPLVSRALQVSGGEAAARRARYAVFEELVGEGEVLFLAHHLDDQVETFILRLVRGAGSPVVESRRYFRTT